MSSFFGNVKTNIHQSFVKTAQSFVPTLKESRFEEKGVLTPEEFVAAGDLLVRKCPTWQWYVYE
jgi:ubiquitin-like-conjugating enzyme ATG3